MIINPIRFIMAEFGYVKIPREAVQLSMAQEEAFKLVIKAIESTGHESPAFRKALGAQRALTYFLRSGRLIT